MSPPYLKEDYRGKIIRWMQPLMERKACASKQPHYSEAIGNGINYTI
jgi:hypothetical protein